VQVNSNQSANNLGVNTGTLATNSGTYTAPPTASNTQLDNVTAQNYDQMINPTSSVTNNTNPIPDNAVNTYTQATDSFPAQPKSKTPLIIAVILIILVLGGGAFAYIKNLGGFFSKSQTSDQVKINSSTQTPTLSKSDNINSTTNSSSITKTVESPSSVLLAANKALYSNDLKTFKTYMADQSQLGNMSDYSDSEILQVLQLVQPKMNKVTKEEISGDSATVEYSCAEPGNPTQSTCAGTAKLIKVNGSWKIDGGDTNSSATYDSTKN
jgi:hypothetical protein